MKSRTVSFSEKAQQDLLDLELWLETQTTKKLARSYTDRLVECCLRLDMASHRGTNRDDLLPNLRTTGFERRVTIAFVVDENEVMIMRLSSAGRDWEADFSED